MLSPDRTPVERPLHLPSKESYDSRDYTARSQQSIAMQCQHQISKFCRAFVKRIESVRCNLRRLEPSRKLEKRLQLPRS